MAVEILTYIIVFGFLLSIFFAFVSFVTYLFFLFPSVFEDICFAACVACFVVCLLSVIALVAVVVIDSV